MISIQWPKIFTIVLVSFIILLYGYGIWQLRDDFTKPYNADFFAKLYQYSQFGEGKLVISDEDLYAYSGYTSLKTGDITKINIEHPPFGKYLIGLSIILFNNQQVLNLLWGGLFLFLSWKISVYFFQLLLPETKSPIVYPLASLLTLMVLLEPMFWDHLTKSLLDLLHAVAVLLFIFLHLQPKKVAWYQTLLLGITLGFAASIKFPALAVILWGSWGAIESYQAWQSKNIRLAINIFYVGLIAMTVYCLNYLPLFIDAGITGFIYQHILALKIHLSHVPEYRPGAIVQVLLLNAWPQWYGTAESLPAPTWHWTWPAFLLAFLYSPLLGWIAYLKKQLPIRSCLLFLLPWLYFGFLASRLFFPNYLFVLLPFFNMYLIGLMVPIFSFKFR